jgi:hypothetical protein
VLKTKEVGVEIRPGDVIHVESGGGGGWGPPRQRTAAAHAADVEAGFVTGNGRAAAPTRGKRRASPPSPLRGEGRVRGSRKRV